MQQDSVHRQWQLAEGGPEAYERVIVPSWMGAWARHLVGTAGLAPGQRVLDLACGTGVVAREARRALGAAGEVTGIDREEGMLQAARRFAGREGLDGIVWRQGDAANIPAESGAFDLVLCQHGLQFFPDRPAALREMARVIRPGGRLALSVWRSIDRCPALAILAEIVERRFGPAAAAVFYASCSLADRDELRDLIGGAGFRDVHIRLESSTARHPSLAEFLSGYLSVFPFAAEIAALEATERAALFRRMAAALDRYVDDDGMAAPMECHVATARL